MSDGTEFEDGEEVANEDYGDEQLAEDGDGSGEDDQAADQQGGVHNVWAGLAGVFLVLDAIYYLTQRGTVAGLIYALSLGGGAVLAFYGAVIFVRGAFRDDRSQMVSGTIILIASIAGSALVIAGNALKVLGAGQTP